MSINTERKIMGKWDGEDIWQEPTPEERAVNKLTRSGFNEDKARKAVELLGEFIIAKHYDQLR